MHKNKENDPGKERDFFYDFIRNKIGEHQLEVNEQCWNEIIYQIRKRKQRKIILRTIYFGVAAAVILALIIIPAIKTTLIKQKTDYYCIKNPVVSQITTQSQNNKHTATFVSEESGNNTGKKEKKETSNTENGTEESTANDLCDNKTSESTTSNASFVSVTENKSSDSSYSNKKNSWNLNNQENIFCKNKKTSQRKWELSASLSTFKVKPNNWNNLQCGTPEPPEQNSVTDVEFAPPFSAGILVRKELNETFGAEAGIIYSYLSTNYKDINRQHSGNLKLHYIGIPANLVVNICEINEQWKIYTTAGIMVEKGIKSDLSIYPYDSDKVINKKDEIDGLQWSVNTSLGLSCKIIQNLSLYIEPRISYYFDNNQPLSIRTQQKTLAGLNVGILCEL